MEIDRRQRREHEEAAENRDEHRRHITAVIGFHCLDATHDDLLDLAALLRVGIARAQLHKLLQKTQAQTLLGRLRRALGYDLGEPQKCPAQHEENEKTSDAPFRARNVVRAEDGGKRQRQEHALADIGRGDEEADDDARRNMPANGTGERPKRPGHVSPPHARAARRDEASGAAIDLSTSWM